MVDLEDGNVIKRTVDLASMKEKDGLITRDVRRRILAAIGELCRKMLIPNRKFSSCFPTQLCHHPAIQY